MVQLEVLWAAVGLMLLGVAVSLCVRCQLSATKREKQPSERQSQLESQQRFEVIRSRSMLATTRRLEQIKEPGNLSIARKTTEELGASCHAGYGSRTESRYQNFLTEDCLRGDAAYVEPISLDYYNCARFFTPPNARSGLGKRRLQPLRVLSRHAGKGNVRVLDQKLFAKERPSNKKDEDSHSYQNVIIGVSHSSDPVTDDTVDYENSTAIHIWKLQRAEALQADSLDDEPDYINTAPASGPAPLFKHSILHKV